MAIPYTRFEERRPHSLATCDRAWLILASCRKPRNWGRGLLRMNTDDRGGAVSPDKCSR